MRSRSAPIVPACLLTVVLVVACGGQFEPAPGADGGGSSSGGGSSGSTGSSGGSGTCATDADCGTGGICGFLQSAGCSTNRGTCFPAPGVTCKGYSPGCTCDGQTISIVCTGLPDGYVPRPLAHTGACGSCTLDSDCPSGDICGFPIAQGCGAMGQCFPQGAVCNGFAPGCACNGQTIDIACEGLPNGYAKQPLLHTGSCEGVDAGATD